MIDNSRLTGATKPVIFSDGTELLLSPLSDKDVTELDNWLRERYLFIQRSSIPEDADEDTKDRIERIAQQTAATLNWYIGYGANMMASIDGLCRILYQSAKRNHTGLTYDEVHAKLLSQNNSEKLAGDAVKDVLNKSFPDNKNSNSEDNSDTANPTKRKKPTKTRKRSIVN